jgi:predicted RNA-binding Zn-ribbon protein involved in translation (DUF1610 family)
MDNIQCTHCHRNIVPRLYHRSRWFLPSLHYSVTQFLCPFCGVVLYERGGHLTGMGKFVLGFLALGIFYTFLAILGSIH